MLGPFYSDAKKAKKNRRSSSSSSHFIFPRDFSGNTVDTDIVNTLLEPLWPTDVPFGDYKTETKEFFATKLIFLAVSSYQHTHTRLTALFWDYPGEPVPER